MYEKDISIRLYVLKMLCILCVIYAHQSSNIVNINYWMHSVGNIAVPLFYILSGFFYRSEVGIIDTLKKKIRTICIPWLIWGTCTYIIIEVIGNSDVSVVNYFRWIFGYSSLYYYLTVLMIMYVLFGIVNSDLFCKICIVANIVSVFLMNVTLSYMKISISF